MLVVITS